MFAGYRHQAVFSTIHLVSFVTSTIRNTFLLVLIAFDILLSQAVTRLPVILLAEHIHNNLQKDRFCGPFAIYQEGMESKRDSNLENNWASVELILLNVILR